MDSHSPPTSGRILRFGAPLAATWLMMSVEGPLIAAIVARLPDSKINLAAYGVAFSFALIIEAPVISMMSASTAIVRDGLSMDRLRRFAMTLCGIVTLLMLILLLPAVFNPIARGLIGLPEDVATLTHGALLILLPWPGTIGYRRFYQGILIRHNLTRRVAYGTIIRLIAMTSAALAFWHAGVPGALVGAIALSVGVTVEALASRAMVHSVLPELKQRNRPSRFDLSYGGLTRFYYPLALTTMLSMGVHPMVTFFVGASRQSIESLAVIPVVTSLVFIFRSFGLAFQDVTIALIGEEFDGFRTLRSFSWVLMAMTTLGLCVLAFTPTAHFWFATVSGLPPDLTALATTVTRVLCLMPALAVLLSFQRALAVTLRVTRCITWATLIEVSGIALTLLLTIRFFDWVGAIAAATALMVGRLGATAYLRLFLRGLIQTSPDSTGSVQYDWQKNSDAKHSA